MILLSNASRLDISQTGGKGRRLALLMAAGHPVQPAAVITPDEVVQIVASGQVPPAITDFIIDHLDFGQCGLAVRSSAVGEDGKDFAFAGMYDTVLGVRLENLEQAILECARGGDNQTSTAYQDQTGAQAGGLALVVQEMVNAKISGVLFTQDPTGHDNCMVVEAIEGLGEDLVSGQREPRRYRIDDTGQILSVDGAETPVLTEQQLIELVQEGVALRERFDAEQDIEWAFSQIDRLWINQSRDITAIESNNNTEDLRVHVINETCSALEAEQTRLRRLGLNVSGDVLSDQNIAEILTFHPCMMAYGLFCYEFAHGQGGIRTGRNLMGYDIGEELNTGFQWLVGGQPRCSIVHDALTYRIQGITLQDYSRLVQYYLDRIADDPRLANYPEVHLYEQNPSLGLLTDLFGRQQAASVAQAYQEFFSGIRQAEATTAKACQDDFIPRWDDQITRMELEQLEPGLGPLVHRYRILADGLRNSACQMFVRVARLGFFVYARLDRMLQKMCGDQAQSYLTTVTSGTPLELNPNLQLNRELVRLREGETSPEAVLRHFGHLGMHELEISVPRYQDDPAPLLQMAEHAHFDPAELEQGQARYQQARDELLGMAGDQRDELTQEIRVARTYLPMRELVKFQYLRAYALMRQACVSMEQELGWEPGLIFHLLPEEVFTIHRDSGRLHVIATTRQAQHQAHRSLYVPTVISSDRLDEIGQVPDEDTSSILHGIGATSEVREGRVVVVKSLDDVEAVAQLQSGCVLVTKTTDPGWVSVLGAIGNTGALVTEVGGALAHGAVYAREVHMAAVLNVPRATERLQTGMLVRVNGAQNIVEILS